MAQLVVYLKISNIISNSNFEYKTTKCWTRTVHEHCYHLGNSLTIILLLFYIIYIYIIGCICIVVYTICWIASCDIHVRHLNFSKQCAICYMHRLVCRLCCHDEQPASQPASNQCASASMIDLVPVRSVW